MLGIIRKDFTIRVENFNLKDPWNILRIICGAFMFPHAASKFIDGALNPGVIGFFAKAGFAPPEAWMILAALVEIGTGIALVFGLCTRFAALGAAGAKAGFSKRRPPATSRSVAAVPIRSGRLFSTYPCPAAAKSVGPSKLYGCPERTAASPDTVHSRQFHE